MREHLICLAVVALAVGGCLEDRVHGEAAARSSADSESSADDSKVPGRLGSRVFVVRRNGGLAVYDYHRRELLDRTITGLGNLHHATMTFSPGLRWGFVASRDGRLSRIDLRSLQRTGSVDTGDEAIDLAIGRRGRFVATAEYEPGGLTVLKANSLEVARNIPAVYREDGTEKRSRATAVVDATGNRFVFSLMEGGEAWIVDADDPKLPVTHRVPLAEGRAYDAMITADGRYYVVGHYQKEYVSVVDVEHPDRGAKKVSLRDPGGVYDPDHPVKLPHMASWATARGRVFVPLVGDARLAVLDRDGWEFEATVELRGDPVYAVRSPEGDEIWVTFSGEEDDAWVQVVDTDELKVVEEFRVGDRIYHADFTPRGTYALVSANETGVLTLIDTESYEVVDRQKLPSPSGIFGIWRAFEIGL
ncbi:MAG: cytochrome D1 domain-containing protein [Bradymonadaceae bacterium]